MGKFISLPTAKLAKEKGFNLESPAYYGCDEPASGRPGNQFFLRDWAKISEIGRVDTQVGTMIYAAPEQEMLREWLREVHQLHVAISPDKSRQNEVIWFSQVFNLSSYNMTFKSFNYITMIFGGSTYEDALELGLLNALQSIEMEKTIIGYRCLLCGRDKFTRKSAHNCGSGYRKHHIKWEAIYG